MGAGQTADSAAEWLREHEEEQQRQREIEALQAYVDSRQELARVRGQVAAMLQELWMRVMREPMAPAEGDFLRWLALASPEEVERAILETACKVRGEEMTFTRKVQRTERAMNKLIGEQG